MIHINGNIKIFNDIEYHLVLEDEQHEATKSIEPTSYMAKACRASDSKNKSKRFKINSGGRERLSIR